jgi:hypothetical protein
VIEAAVKAARLPAGSRENRDTKMDVANETCRFRECHGQRNAGPGGQKIEDS